MPGLAHTEGVFRRRVSLTPQEKADRKWERMASQPRTMGMVGIFNDVNPGAKHAEAQIVQQREMFADQQTPDGQPLRGNGPEVDPRSPAGSGKGSVTISLTTASKPPKPEAD